MKNKSFQSKHGTNVSRLEEPTIRLPKDYPWKILGSLVQDLSVHLTQDEHHLLSQVIRDRDVDAYQILSEQWSLQFCTNSHNSVALPSFRAKYQLTALLSKYQFDGDKNSRRMAAIDKFIEAETICKNYNQYDYKEFTASKTEFDTTVFTAARAFLLKLLGEKCPTSEILTKWSRHGPGANLDTKMGVIDIYEKFNNWPYSCTQRALPYAVYLIKTDKRWLGFLDDDYRARNNIPKHMIINQRRFWTDVFRIVPGNKITFVPKNARTDRSIAIEPTMNLMLQLGVDGYIRSRLKRWDVDLDSQLKNQNFARLGSQIDSLDSYVTLDLKAASDSVSKKIVEILLPPEWYDYLMKLRSPSGDLNGETINYNKISSMGNGYTFALESAIFTSLCYGVMKASTGSCNPKTDFSIFGDDIIVRKRYASKIIDTFKRAGFQLNLDKSFISGPARESCGTDWLWGKPVRPIFLKGLPASGQDVLVDLNRLKRLLELRWGVLNSKTESLITKWLPEMFQKFKGPYSDTEFDSYIHTNVPHGTYVNCGIRYQKLIRKLLVSNDSKNFFCRKLMNPLRQVDLPPISYVSSRVKVSKGSCFDVVLRNKSTLATTYSVTDFWLSNYTDI